MAALSGLEKFSHLEDKIYRAIEVTKNLQHEKEGLELELSAIRGEMGALSDERRDFQCRLSGFLLNAMQFAQEWKQCLMRLQ